MPDDLKCPKCDGNLHEGFYYVRNNENLALFNYVVFVNGSQDDIFRIIKNADELPQYKVRPFRCDSCGYIEYYAKEPEKWRH